MLADNAGVDFWFLDLGTVIDVTIDYAHMAMNSPILWSPHTHFCVVVHSEDDLLIVLSLDRGLEFCFRHRPKPLGVEIKIL